MTTFFDKRLIGFADRLAPTMEKQFEAALNRIASRVQSELDLQFVPINARPGSLQSSVKFIAPNLQAALELFNNNVAELADSLIAEAQKNNLTKLYQLEMPRGCLVAVWKEPLRLICDYCINLDAIACGIDLRGESEA
jgi:hypothetical protein